MIKNNDKDFEITDIVENTSDNEENNTCNSRNRFNCKEAKKNLKERILSAFVLIILLSIFIVPGALYTSLLSKDIKNVEIASYFSIAFTMFLVAICIFEMNKTLNIKYWYYQLSLIIIAFLIYLFPINSGLYNFGLYQKMHLDKWVKAWQFPIVLLIYIGIFTIIGLADKRIEFTKSLICAAMSIVIIIAFKTYSITSLSLSDNKAKFSFNTIIWIWGMMIFSDSFQYVGGMRFGKTKLSPNISPKKTWEGALIGMSVGTVFGIVYAIIFRYVEPLRDFEPLREPLQSLEDKLKCLDILIIILLSIIFPIVGLFGDLLFSSVKRYINIKDYSKLIPGHGGALDRLDSIIFSLFMTFIIIFAIPI